VAQIKMRLLTQDQVPQGGGTAVQEDPRRPVFRGNGSDDYVCANCGNVLAASMAPEYMNRKLRVRCGNCRKINAGIEVGGVDYNKAFGKRGRFQS
jgi:DNA-directed RNA polymerase subunit RPC12/RpoP